MASSEFNPFSSAFSTTEGKPPQQIFKEVYAFPPNRETLGGAAYYIVENGKGILLDCPLWSEENYRFLLAQGGVRALLLTHRGAMSKVKQIQEAMQCEVIVQEQEAYLLPEVKTTTFATEVTLSDSVVGIWSPGHSPGSSCFYWKPYGGVLFTGRHLLPNQHGEPTPLRTAKTFHWFRQLRSLQGLRDRFTPETLQHICPGANTGFLRGAGTIERAYERLLELDLEALRQVASPF